MSADPFLAVPLVRRGPAASRAERLEARLRLVLETRPGRLPWRPDFGCDLAALVGEPATPQNLGRAKYQVDQALARWLPDVRVVRCEVALRPILASVAPTGAPVGEGALLSLGTQAVLHVHLDLDTALGPVQVSADVQP
jgi:phage baseplate assembly protein W